MLGLTKFTHTLPTLGDSGDASPLQPRTVFAYTRRTLGDLDNAPSVPNNNHRAGMGEREGEAFLQQLDNAMGIGSAKVPYQAGPDGECPTPTM